MTLHERNEDGVCAERCYLPIFERELAETLKSTFFIQKAEGNKLRKHLCIVVRYFGDVASWSICMQSFDIPALQLYSRKYNEYYCPPLIVYNREIFHSETMCDV